MSHQEFRLDPPSSEHGSDVPFGEKTDYRVENRRASPSEVAGGQRQAGPPLEM